MARDVGKFDNECFFIAPIGDVGSDIRDRSDGILEFIVRPAAETLGMQPVRADGIAEPGQITMQVIDHVLRAKAAVVDLTGLNANVFYELAVRHAARLPTVLIAEADCKPPFDIAQMRTIFFDYHDLKSANECREQIVAHLREAIENGENDSPIATTIDVSALQAGSAMERNVAELVTSVDDVLRAQRSLQQLVLDIERRQRRSMSRPLHPGALEDLLDRFEQLRNVAISLKDHPRYADLADAIRETERPVRFLAMRSARARTLDMSPLWEEPLRPEISEADPPGWRMT